MSNNLKDLIDKAELEERTRSELQKTIDKLNLEIANLRKKLNEREIKLKSHLKTTASSFKDSEEIDSLKKIISSQKEQLDKKEQQNKQLQVKISRFDSEIERSKSNITTPANLQISTETKELERILEDYARLENLNIILTQNVKELEMKNITLTENLKPVDKLKSKSQQFEKDYNFLKTESDRLLEQNTSLKNDINQLKSNIASLLSYKEKVEDLTSQINQKSNESQILQETINKLRIENISLKKLESIVPTLEAEVNTLKLQKDTIKEKNSILLAKTITAMSSQEKGKKEQIKENVIESPRKIESKKINEPILFSKSEKDSKLKSFNHVKTKGTKEKIELPEPQKSVQELIAEEISVGNNTEVIKRKWECPKCGNIDKTKIREIPDKARIIYGTLYAKKYKCGLCANEWC